LQLTVGYRYEFTMCGYTSSGDGILELVDPATDNVYAGGSDAGCSGNYFADKITATIGGVGCYDFTVPWYGRVYCERCSVYGPALDTLLFMQVL
jgi:hypothetical protein